MLRLLGEGFTIWNAPSPYCIAWSCVLFISSAPDFTGFLLKSSGRGLGIKVCAQVCLLGHGTGVVGGPEGRNETASADLSVSDRML